MSGEKKKKQSEKYVPEIIEAVDNRGEASWYFALIKADHFKAYEAARDDGRVDIKKNDEDILFVCIDGEKCGQIIDSGEGAPSEEQREAFIKEHGVPCLEGTTIKDDETEIDEAPGGEPPPGITNNKPTTGPWPR